MVVQLLTEHHLEFLSLKGGYRGSSESSHVEMPHCWKTHALAHLSLNFSIFCRHILIVLRFDFHRFKMLENLNLISTMLIVM